MHRTQILLEPEQYEFLRREADEMKVSISERVRLLVLQRMATRRLEEDAPIAPHPDGDDPLEGIIGIGEDPDGLSGRDHDLILYGWKKR